MTTVLRSGADCAHETAREWYDSYGYSLPIEDAEGYHYGDMDLQRVEYDWLDDGGLTDDQIVARLGLDEDESHREAGECLIARARDVRAAGEWVVSLLEDAVAAESEHGDDPAAAALRERLLDVLD